jgi:hypothetical protein
MPATNDRRGRGRPRKLTLQDELAIYHARSEECGVPWKDLVAQYGVSRSVLAEAYHRAELRISGQNNRISGHLGAGQATPA